MSRKKRLAALRLQVEDPASLATFYVDVLGMQAEKEAVGEQDAVWRVGYPGEDADLLLFSGGVPYRHERNDRYWKIGICLPDLDLAYAQLLQRGVQVTAPRQFLNIGYMMHLSDPAGFVIELLQHDFASMREMDGDGSLPLGGGGHIGQITLRTGDIAKELAVLGDMRLLSVQDVAEYGFDLHFLAYTNETPPKADLTSVANRPWLWRRPYTTLEFQHQPGASFDESSAYLGLDIEG